MGVLVVVWQQRLQVNSQKPPCTSQGELHLPHRACWLQLKPSGLGVSMHVRQRVRAVKSDAVVDSRVQWAG